MTYYNLPVLKWKMAHGISHVYVTLTTLWKFFYYSPKQAACFKAVQQVLDLPELKIINPSDTQWLPHERCGKAMKANFSTIVTTLDSIYEQTHEPEALGISKALCKFSTISAIFFLILLSQNCHIEQKSSG